MVTGETDVTELSKYLILGWDGRILQWSSGQKGEIIEAGEESILSIEGLLEFCKQLNKNGFGQGAVLFHYRHAFFTVAPSSVAKGHEEEFLELHLGPGNEVKSHHFFFSDAFGDELVFMERWDSAGLRSELQQTWPHVRFESSSLRWIENMSAVSRNHSKSVISVDIGTHRALLSRVEKGKLLWAMVSEDLEGEGLLYHIVNALHRDGLEPQSSGAKVLLSGEVEAEGAWIGVFNRFFMDVERAPSAVEVPGMKMHGWMLHTNLETCV
jgi:hypothetical protein